MPKIIGFASGEQLSSQGIPQGYLAVPKKGIWALSTCLILVCFSLLGAVHPGSETGEKSETDWVKPAPKVSSFEATLIFENTTKKTVAAKGFRKLEGDWVDVLTTKDKHIYLKCKEIIFEEKE